MPSIFRFSSTALTVALTCVGLICATPVSALPSGRVYELVSPIYKAGYGVREIEAVGPTGISVTEPRVAFWSVGAFAGVVSEGGQPGYLSVRSNHGWSTEPLRPPAAMTSSLSSYDFDPTLVTEFANSRPGPNLTWTELESIEDDLWLHRMDSPDIESNWNRLGAPLTIVSGNPFFVRNDGASSDFCHVVLYSGEPISGVSGADTENLYDLQHGCANDSLTLIGAKNDGEAIEPRCKVGLGAREYAATSSQFNAVAADGQEIFFTVGTGGNLEECLADHQIYVRLGDSRTIEVSKPLSESCTEVPCTGASKRAGADFVGASKDGSGVFFTTRASLVADDTDTTTDLYVATVGCPGDSACQASEKVVTDLTKLTNTVGGGEPANVQGTVRLAPDGSRVYYVAQGLLTSEPNHYGELPSKGADNLYVYDVKSGETSFITQLCSGGEASGTVTDLRCPVQLSGIGAHNDTSLWGSTDSGEGREAQTAGQDGRFLLFSSYGQLTPDDTDIARDVYRYDAVSGTLVRVSLGEDGYDANGNGSVDAQMARGHLGGLLIWQNEMDRRAIDDEGSRIVFTSAEQLSPAAVNGAVNVYEWEQTSSDGQGRVSLVSGGAASTGDTQPVISSSGSDIFFITTQGLSPSDTDGQADIYDARAGGGFPPAQVVPEACSADACQGPLSQPVPVLPGSMVQTPGENVPVVGPARPTRKTAKGVSKKAKKAKRARRGSKAGQSVTTGGASGRRHR